MKSTNQKIHLPQLQSKNISLTIKREDLIHPLISGNKYRKLKYNTLAAKKLGHTRLLSFGGAYSNHIAATACVGKEAGFQTIGVIRGEELEANWKQNPTLQLASTHGMQFHFVSRDEYRNKTDQHFLSNLKERYGSFYLLPEGGTNELAIKGCQEILNEDDVHFDIITSSVGTGGTIAGLINTSSDRQQILGFSALKGDFLKEDIRKFANKSNWKLIENYHFGGFAKVNQELVSFINWFKLKTGIPLDPIYSGKMMFGILDLVERGVIKPNSTILAIHTGGLQGILGMNHILKNKNISLIDL